MLVIDADAIRSHLSLPDLIDRLAEAFEQGDVAAHRLVISLPGGDGDRQFLAMPAFRASGGGITKLVTVQPDNAVRGQPVIQAALVLFSDTGKPIAFLDGTVITHLRTGATSALASRYLSRADSRHLLVMGTGALAPFMAMAHCEVRPIDRVTVWGRSVARAEATAAQIRTMVGPLIEVVTSDDLAHSVPRADIVSCATNSATPLFDGQLLRPGTFIDAVGSFSPQRRETDDATIKRSRLFVDTFEGAMTEAGDILEPISRGVIAQDHIEGDLAGLVRGEIAGRRSPEDIILFKSVGSAVEDLAAADMIVAAARAGVDR